MEGNNKNMEGNNKNLEGIIKTFIPWSNCLWHICIFSKYFRHEDQLWFQSVLGCYWPGYSVSHVNYRLLRQLGNHILYKDTKGELIYTVNLQIFKHLHFSWIAKICNFCDISFLRIWKQYASIVIYLFQWQVLLFYNNFKIQEWKLPMGGGTMLSCCIRDAWTNIHTKDSSLQTPVLEYINTA